MPYIYKIENKLNGKVYIGKTMTTIQKCWKQHRNDAGKEKCQNRPLYRAIKKYGIDNFFIEEIEECDGDILSDREKYWIEYYNSFKCGYNATIGGDGKPYVNRNLVLQTYQKVGVMKQVAKLFNISVDSVKNVLEEKHIEISSSQEINKKFLSKAVMMLSLTGESQKVFESLSEAAHYLNEERHQNSDIRGIMSHITQVCKGKRKTAYNHKWQWI